MFKRYSRIRWNGLETLHEEPFDMVNQDQKINARTRFGYPIYTPEEVVALKLPVKDWRRCQVGDWGVSDDNWISQCISVKGPLYRFVAGTVKEGHKFLVENRLITRNFSDITTRSHQERELRRERTKRVVHAYARMMVSGTINWEVLGNLYRPDQKIPVATVKRLFKMKGIDRMVKEELDKLLTSQGLTPEYTLSKLKKAMDIAEAGKQPIAMLRGTEFLAELQHLNDKQTATVEIGMTSEFFDNVKRLKGTSADVGMLQEAEVVPERDTSNDNPGC